MMNISTELVEQFARGNGVIFVGAGLSQGAGLPGWADLVRELASELDGCPTDVDYREIAQYYDIEHSRQRLVQRLRDQLDTLKVSPTSVHAELVKLSVPIIFTTNYDDLLEQALRAAKCPYTPVVGNADISFWSVDRLQLVKLHGDLNQPESIIITTEDYDRFASSRKSLADILKVILQTKTVLFLGYSATDPDLRLILTQARDESGRLARNLYTVQFSPPPLTIKDLERRGLKVIDLAEQTESATRNAAMLTWLQALGEKIAGETLKLKPATPPQPQTAVQVLAAEIQIWLKAMGYTVINRPGDDRIIDLEATLKRGLAEQHVLVRCVAGEITVRHLVTLQQDLETRNIPKGWTVSDRRVPPSARAFAEANPSVRPFSLADFVSQIFGPYFDNMRRLVEESDIPKYYVDLACYRRVLNVTGQEIGYDHYEVIDTYVDDWLQARDANHLSIFGEFGSGKTWFCRHYAYRQLERYLADPVHERLPILVTLRDYIKQVEVGSFIRKLFDEQGVQLGGSLEALEELNQRGKLLLIFDGFDEMALKVDYQLMVDYFWELAKVVVPGSKALLTCRTGYFRYATEAEKVMGGEERGCKMIVIQPPQFQVIYLKPFSFNQIQEVITRRSGIEVAKVITSHPQLNELVEQPVLIEMLLEVWPDIQSIASINRSEIYRLLVDRWLDQDISIGRTFMNKQDKLFFMMKLAWEMFSTGDLRIHYKDLNERVNRYFELKQSDEQAYYDYDIRTKSFLQWDTTGSWLTYVTNRLTEPGLRNLQAEGLISEDLNLSLNRGQGYFEFAHRSLVEFLVALQIYKQLEDGKDLKLEDLITVSSSSKTLDDVDFIDWWRDWQVIFEFLWEMGPIGKLAKNNIRNQAISLMLKNLIRFYESDQVKYGRFRDQVELTVLESLESLEYEHLEIWTSTCGCSLCLEDYFSIEPAIFNLAVTKALRDNHLETARFLNEFLIKLRDMAEGSSEDYSRLAEAERSIIQILQLFEKMLIGEESSTQIFLPGFEVEQSPRVQWLEQEVIPSLVSKELLEILRLIYELIDDEQTRLSLANMIQYLEKILYRQLANDQHHLFVQLENSDWIEKWKAIYTLGEFGDVKALEPLDKLLVQETNPTVRQIAVVAIQKINHRANNYAQVSVGRDK